MSTQVYFNKPMRSINTSQLHQDIRATSRYLALASAWFTDVDIANSFVDSASNIKTVLFNAADINRGNRRAYEIITSYFNNPVDWWDQEDECAEDTHRYDRTRNRNELIYAAPGSEQYGVEDSDYYSEKARLRFVVLGSGDWTEGVMHHKFIVCDNVVWVGSYNFTFQARKNYETLIRIDDRDVARQFRDEVERLVGEPNKHYSTSANGVFSCDNCGKTFPQARLGYEVDQTYGGESSYVCISCARKEDIDWRAMSKSRFGGMTRVPNVHQP